jgi:hypothetical protein
MAVQFYYLANEFAKGYRCNIDSPLQWDRIRLNLPGVPVYDPTFPCVMMWDGLISEIAGDLMAFVEDL